MPCCFNSCHYSVTHCNFKINQNLFYVHTLDSASSSKGTEAGPMHYSVMVHSHKLLHFLFSITVNVGRYQEKRQ